MEHAAHAGQDATSLGSGVSFSPPSGSQSQGRKAAWTCWPWWDATGQEAAGWEEGRRKEEEAFRAFVSCLGLSRQEGKEVTLGP